MMMFNLAMKRKIEKNEAIDLSENSINADGDYILDQFIDGKDYCDSKKEEWIWSIGRHMEYGYILASTTTKFYQHDDFECLFLK